MRRETKTKLYVDIGTWGIKVLEAQVYHGVVEILRYDTIKTPPGLFEEGAIKDPAAFAQVLEEGLRSGGYRSKIAVLTIASTGILTREILLPKAPYKDLVNMVDMEVPNHFPVDISQYSIDFKVLEEVTEGGASQYRIMLLVTPLAALRSYIEAFERCGLFIDRIDYKGNSITKLLGRQASFSAEQSRETYAVIDIGYGSSNITICKNGIIRYGRSFPYGTSQYNDELIEITGCGEEDAEAIKQEIGAYTCADACSLKENAARRAWVKLSVPFFDEVTRVFDFFTSRGGDNSIDRILLTGGSSMMPQLLDYMNNFFDTNLGFLSCQGIVTLQEPGVDMHWFSAYFANCVGSIFQD